MPSHKIHTYHAIRYLRSQNIIPDIKIIQNINLLIDVPKRYAPKILEKAESDIEIKKCIEKEFQGNNLLPWILPAFKHDLRTQRISPKSIDWSKIMISVLRRLVLCVYGREYSDLVDLHVLLDMAQKMCCYDDVIDDWSLKVGITEKVMKYYKENKIDIEKELRCRERRRLGKCTMAELYRMINFSD